MSKNNGVVAIYDYTVPYGIIPLLIVKKKVDRNTLRETFDRKKGGIILTEKDIEDGQDVFALRFLHMQQHASLIDGKDVLAKIDIKKKKARHALETMLRVTLIDLREFLIQKEIDKELTLKLAFTFERLSSYIPLLTKKGAGKKHLEACLLLCGKESLGYDELVELYEHTEKLTAHIDKL